eukprot:354470-Chlamydomonas_euryale.AAC.26
MLVVVAHYKPPQCSHPTLVHKWALLPAFASGVYYDRKFSSTVITSLVSSTPIIADHNLLRAYW